MNTCVIETPTGDELGTFDCADGETVLDAAAAAGWEFPYSCRRGICETCRAPVRGGEVSPPADADGTALLCRTRALTDIRVAPGRAERVELSARKRVNAKLYRRRMAAPDVTVVDLRFPAGVRASFKAGQYLRVLIEGQEPRSFSLANPPRVSDAAQLHVRVLPGSLFGEQILPRLEPGEEVVVELPFGDFYLREAPGEPVVLVAGGTGFAPIQSILEDALPRHPDRQFTLYWGARQSSGLYAMEQVQKWQRKHPHFRFAGVISDEDSNAPLRRGLVHEAVLADCATLAGTQVYVCGAPALVAAAREAFVKQRHLPAANFYSDAFVTTAS
ncbi:MULTISPECIES: 2Fe-2S iron-sulfur cluster-binding protein [unclassified Variovorax]|uniref:2Fe-2S iron-sulfur cluster-binding protein n=1 Tax=unclassified Variovorax TaxID=663243 RepID=UPI0008392E33|nr:MULTISPECIES: 2Fe-2S iron-sulfur cluster-binding protein [unclassified Variovorax]PNG46091.1 Terephthalate 1,2-dioxygenase, reductase component 2 [Variovorax sp. B2]PNG46250.1 Terephthalate 1,2-dioxygenase, reductase component 2 [Variovorax sp. B4]VTV19207.1 TPADO reductase component [Variovorax sp. WDL1]